MRIYLAGLESRPKLLDALDYPYRLCSYLSLRGSGAARDKVLESAEKGGDWIMDSGLFTFMFGAGKGQLKTFDDYKAYAEKYVEDVKAWGWDHEIVECDVQRVLGVDECHKLREDVFEQSGLSTMYVWHIPEKEDGLREMARKYKRLAISIPEFREVFSKKENQGQGDGLHVRRATLRALKIIRDEQAEARVHLLGNTENKLLKAPAPAWSSDSTSWLYAVSYGKGTICMGGRMYQVSVHSPRWQEWRDWCRESYPSVFEQADRTLNTKIAKEEALNGIPSAISYKLMMERINGSADD